MNKNYTPLHTFVCFLLLIMTSFSISAQEKNISDSLKSKNADNGKSGSFFYEHALPNDENKWFAPHLSVSMFNPFYENPGFCGINQTFSYNTACNVDMPFYKLTDVGYHPISFFTSFEFSAGKKRASGFGSCFYQSRVGSRIRSIINNSYSYKIHIGKFNNLRLGISLNIFDNRLDFARMRFNDMIDPRHGFVFDTQEQLSNKSDATTWNINAGITFIRKRFYVGFSVLNICKPYKDKYPGYYFFKKIDKMAAQYQLSSGYTLVLTRNVDLSASARMQYYSKQCNANFHITGVFWHHFIAGISLNKLTTMSLDLGCSYWNILTFYVSGGISTDSELYYHFGPLNYVSANLRIQLGKYQEKF